ncbi:MAG: TetR/AcrR family transcriptional regulator C-terminal domain-containing protein [Syntrophomonadaceae bacterium]
MGKKKEYRSAIRSRRLIRQAFVELMKEKALEKITVTDIVTRADINRGTFYAHFQDTRAVTEQIENELIEKLLEFLGEIRYEGFSQNRLTLLLKISNYLEEDVEFYRIIMNLRWADRFLVKLKDIFVNYMQTSSDIPEHIKSSPEFLIRAHFVAGGIVNLYQAWFRGDIDKSLDEMTLEINKIIATGEGDFFQ